jgi:hypothetical protein
MPYAPKPPLCRAADAGKRAINPEDQRSLTVMRGRGAPLVT